MATLLPEGKQSFTNSAGAPLVGGKVYTYDAGTNTPRPTYQDAAGTVPNTNPVILDARGEATIFWSGAYKVVLKDASDATIWTVDNVSGVSAIDLSSSAGAGLVGFLYAAVYGAGTIGKWLQDLATSVGSTFIGFLQGGVGAVLRTLQSRLRDSISVKDFGAVGDGVTDDTAAIQAAIVYAAQAYQADWFSNTAYAVPRVVDFPSSKYKINGKILVPRGIRLRGNNSTLVGTGYAVTDNICFETAYFNAGVITSNIGTAPETQRVQYSVIEGFKFTLFRICCNLYNFNEGCAVRDCAFADVRQAVVAARCFYAEFTTLMNRLSAGGATEACFVFSTFCNVETIRNVTAVDRVLGFQFDGGVNGQLLSMVNAESCTTGMKFLGEVNPINIDSCYFEASTTGIDFTDASAHRAVTIDNCWFAQLTTGITGIQMLSGRIGPGNYFLNVTNKVIINDVVSTIDVYMPPSRVLNGLPALPAGYTLGKAVRAIMPYHVYDGGSGNSVVKQDYSGGLVALPYSGEQGVQASNVPFCTNSSSNPGGTPFDVFIDTKITYDSYVMYIFAVQISDNTGTYQIRGRGYGNTTFLDTASGKTCVATNNGGFLRLRFSSFSHPTGVYGVEGIVRMV